MDDKDKMNKKFPITSICRNDILQMIEDRIEDGGKLKQLMLKRGVDSITDIEMEYLASKMCDDFCDCCFWDNLEYRFKRIIEDKYNNDK